MCGDEAGEGGHKKTWFITGASRGLGARIAQLALERAENVVATARNVGPIEENLGDRSCIHTRIVPSLKVFGNGWARHFAFRFAGAFLAAAALTIESNSRGNHRGSVQVANVRS